MIEIRSRYTIYVSAEIWGKWKALAAKGHTSEEIIQRAIETMNNLPDGFGRKNNAKRHIITTNKKYMIDDFELEAKRTGYTYSDILRLAMEDMLDEHGML